MFNDFVTLETLMKKDTQMEQNQSYLTYMIYNEGIKIRRENNADNCLCRKR